MKRYKICVLGGSGFLGREICRLIVAMGHQAVSVSRRGRPALAQPWVEGVKWIQADILDADGSLGDWTDALQDCEAVIHSIGIGREDASSGQLFGRLHRDSVGASARAAQQAGVAKFVFISAEKLPPGLPYAYLQTKLDGESVLQNVDIPVAILRPTFIHTGTPALFGVLAEPSIQPIDNIRKTGEITEFDPAVVPPDAERGLGAESSATILNNWVLNTPGLRLEKVAMTALRAALQPETVGIIDPAAIDHLGDAMFIQ